MNISTLLFHILILLFNEKNAPEVLPYDYSLVHFFWEISSYQNNLLNCPVYSEKQSNFLIEIKKIELDRIIYILKTYHRYRIWKIEKEIDSRTRKTFFSHCSSEEKSYASIYKFITRSCYSQLFLDFVPEVLRKKGIENCQNCMPKKHRGHFFVFFRVLRKKKFIENNILLAEEPLNFYGNAIYSMKFSSVRRLVVSGIICLL
mmetsp:Transcript_32747/g.50806  ORF Transcript_32747/g.50806 Transcript_32747/m.50806 type:complete len:203 (-) Transcript_32747:113-721(-)